MAKIIAIDRKLRHLDRQLVLDTDDDGASCCCGPDCCRYTSPSSPCVYANESNGQGNEYQPGEYQDCATCIRFRRLATGTMHLIVRYRHLISQDNGDGRSFSRGSVAIGLAGRMSVCYTASGASPIGTCYLEGALYDQLESFDVRTGRRFSRDYARAGTTDEGTRTVPFCSTANLPLITRDPEWWTGDVALFQTVPESSRPTITHNPIHATFYAFNTWGPWQSSNPIIIRNHCQCRHTYTSTSCAQGRTGTASWDQTATIADNGVSGSLVYRRTRSENCTLIGTTYRVRETELIEYDCEWIRQPCRCAGGPTEFAPVSLPPVPSAPVVSRMSALEML